MSNSHRFNLTRKQQDIIWWLVCALCVALIVVGNCQGAEPYRDQELRKLLPKIEDETLTAKLSDPLLFLLHDADFPRAYQDYVLYPGDPGPGLPGVHSAWYNKSGDAREIATGFGNANREFPWGDTAGTHKVKNLYKFRFLYLPPRAYATFSDGSDPIPSDTRWPIVWFGEDRVGVGYNWLYPLGAIVGEVLCLLDEEGKAWPFEVRTRERALDHWEMEVYRPVGSAEQLLAIAKERGLTSLATHLAKPSNSLGEVHLTGQHERNQFRAKGLADPLPAIPAQTAKELLARPFQALSGTPWRAGASSPTTTASFHIVPANYELSPISIPDGCIKCHEDTNQHVDKFSPSRDWYGQVRGSDGIFSIHPFSKSSISTNGNHFPVSMNATLERLGMFARYDKTLHPRDIYRRIKGLQ